MSRPPDPAQELRHPGAEVETWEFDFADAREQFGGWVRLEVLAGKVRYHAAFAGLGRQYVLVADEDVPVPKDGSLELRTEGLWATHICETPFEHWTLGCEAFAVGLDDPLDAYGKGWGDVVALGIDMEWEDLAAPLHVGNGAYQSVCRVSGELLVGPDSFDLDCAGWRAHRWAGPEPGEPRQRLHTGDGRHLVVAGSHGWVVEGREVGEAEPVEADPIAATPVVVGGEHRIRTLATAVLGGAPAIGWTEP